MWSPNSQLRLSPASQSAGPFLSLKVWTILTYRPSDSQELMVLTKLLGWFVMLERCLRRLTIDKESLSRIRCLMPAFQARCKPVRIPHNSALKDKQIPMLYEKPISHFPFSIVTADQTSAASRAWIALWGPISVQFTPTKEGSSPRNMDFSSQLERPTYMMLGHG